MTKNNTLAMPSARAGGPADLSPSVSALPGAHRYRAWTLHEAVALCRVIETICPAFGCHVALTGGTLYKDGERKDCDILFYRIRQIPEIDVDGLFGALALVGIVKRSGFGWCHKATYDGREIDCFFPEDDGGEYEQADPQDIPFSEEFF